MAKSVLSWVGLLLGVVGIIAFVYGLTVLIANGNCGCSSDGFCSGPACPPADNLGFLGLFGGIWVAIGGFILMGVARAHGRVQQWRAQLASGTATYPGFNRAAAYGMTGAARLVTPGVTLPVAPTASPAVLSAETILARDAEAGVPGLQPAHGDVAGRLQELDALKSQGVLNDDEYATQRKRILDSI